MTTASRPFGIVVALDGSQYAEVVIEHALDQAARHDATDLHFVRIIEDAREPIEQVKNQLATLVLEGLDAFRDGRRDWRARLHVRTGKPAVEITDLAGELAADLIVIGRFGGHARHSTADRVLDLTTCPTLVVGLTGSSIDARLQCAECVAIRASSDGHRWFCTAHSAPDRLSLTTLLPLSTSTTGGGPLW